MTSAGRLSGDGIETHSRIASADSGGAEPGRRQCVSPRAMRWPHISEIDEFNPMEGKNRERKLPSYAFSA